MKKPVNKFLLKKTKKKAAKSHEHRKAKPSGGSSSLSNLDKTVTKYINSRASKKILERASKMGEKFKFLSE